MSSLPSYAPRSSPGDVQLHPTVLLALEAGHVVSGTITTVPKDRPLHSVYGQLAVPTTA